jgi:hypothetical protein
MIAAQNIGQLGQRDVLLRLNRGQNHVPERLDPVRADVAAHGQRSGPALVPPGPHPTNGRGDTHPEPLRGRPARQATINRREHTRA